MPMYEYECPKCHLTKEEIVRNADEEVQCPECGELMKRMVAKSNFALKGRGWAKDGYSKI